MSLFRRGARAKSVGCVGAPQPPLESAAAGLPPAALEHALSLIGTYVTDGRSLFHVQHAIWDRAGGAPLFELENCGTLELLVCQCDALDSLRLRVAVPAESAFDIRRCAAEADDPQPSAQRLAS
jgi:hypothetical protein